MKRTKRASTGGSPKKARTRTASKPKEQAVEQMEDAKKLMYMLELNQIELEHQNQELRIAEEELEVSRNKYVNLFDFSPAPLFVLDMDGIIKEANLCASEMLGIGRSKLIGKRFVTHIPQGERAVFDAFMKSVFSSSTKHSCKLSVINKDKLVFHVLLEGIKSGNVLESVQECQIALIDLAECKKAED